MFCQVLSFSISGVKAVPITVEADISNGLPSFTIVGSASSLVREAEDRVRTALRNMDVQLPPKRMTINLAPGYFRKDGTRFDLPIAASLLIALGRIPASAFEKTFLIGELHLDGRIESVNGVLPGMIIARETGVKRCIVPEGCAAEAAAVDGLEIIALHSLNDLIQYVREPDRFRYQKSCEAIAKDETEQNEADFSDILGQESVKRAALISAAGFHNLLLSGPPGSGKSMTAKRIPTILPPITKEESLEISGIYSVAGLLTKDQPLIRSRPFRSPHHSLTPSALCGGGRIPVPGEISLAHKGVLFIDELPEMSPRTLEYLRQPLEDHQITISRSGISCLFPADFLLVGAMNPCPCGFYPDMEKCHCSPRDIERYRKKISRPILDRFDLLVSVHSVKLSELNTNERSPISSAYLRKQVIRAYQIQKERYRDCGIPFNSSLSARDIQQFCPMTPAAERLLNRAFSQYALSARGYHKILKVSRTIADLDSSEKISETHVSEALCFRNQI